MPVIESKLALFQVQIKGAFAHAAEFRQAALGVAPKALDAVDVCFAAGELAAPVRDAQMPAIAHIHQAVVAAPAVRIHRAVQRHAPADNGL